MIVTDSFGRPFRQGTTDVAIGVAGLPAILDLRGTSDRIGYELRASRVAVADEIAAAADLARGKAEGVPVVIVRGLQLAGRRHGAGARDRARARPLSLSVADGPLLNTFLISSVVRPARRRYRSAVAGGQQRSSRSHRRTP